MRDDLQHLPFPALLDAIEHTTEADPDALPDLLNALAPLPDPEPLAIALVRAARRGLLDRTDTADALLALLPTLTDTAIQRLLRATAAAPLDHDALQPLIRAAIAATRRLDIERIAALCLLDRWLKNASPAERDARVDDALHAAQEAIDLDRIEALHDRELLLLPGRHLPDLDDRADALGRLDAWRARTHSFARSVLDVLQRAPRSLSQANAEELLSRRVYTDPGHFLIELLQNAEDAGATRFEIAFHDDHVTAWHDGAPFDARDVVGVLSIGQTTKAREQIGFFGVGFKAVFELTDRPQLYDRLFAFEIADVSIPRPLARRPDTPHPPQGTLLVLPLRDPHDPLRHPDTLYQRALKIPAETLLTLNNLRSLKLQRGDRARTLTAHTTDATTTRLHHHETETTTTWLTERHHATFPGPRELHRARATDLLVAVQLDADGLPTPIDEHQPTLYCHLPTTAASGLRFLVHARFDLPVDRERLNLNSPFNAWALQQAAIPLARLAARLAPPASTALLDVLPLPADLPWPALLGMLHAAIPLLAPLPLLPGADGAPLAPAQAALLDSPALADALAATPLTLAGHRAAAPLPPRRAALAIKLGALDFGPDDLVALLTTWLDHPDPAPPFSTEALLTVLDALGASLTPARTDALARLHLLPDDRHDLHPPRALHRAPTALRALYPRALRTLLLDRLDLDPTPGHDALLRALAPPRITAETLLDDLHDPDTAALILQHAPTDALRDALASLPGRLRARLTEAPIWRATSGDLHPLRRLATPPEHPALIDLYAHLPTRPIAHPDTISLATWLDLAHTLTALSWATLAIDLASAAEALDAAYLDRALDALARVAATLPPDALDALYNAPIFPTLDLEDLRLPPGRWAAPSPERAHLPTEALLPLLRPAPWPLLRPTPALLPLLHALGATPPTPAQLLALVRATDALLEPGRASRTRAALAAALADSRPDPALTDVLQALPLWPDDQHRLHRPTALLLPDALPDALLAALDPNPPRLHPDAVNHATTLRHLLRFRDPATLLDEAITQLGRPGHPLAEQAPFLNATPRVTAALTALHRLLPLARLKALPVGVNALQRLACPPLLRAEPDERLLATPALATHLADPVWAEVAATIDEALAPRLAPRRLLDDLAHATPDHLTDPSTLDALARWLPRHEADIAADPQALATLRRAPIALTAAGQLAPPEHLLYALDLGYDDLPDLQQLDLQHRLPDPALPAALRHTLQRLCRPDDNHLRPLLLALIEQHKAAQSDNGPTRSEPLLRTIAILLTQLAAANEAQLRTLCERYRIHKLRIFAADNQAHKVTHLLTPPQGHADLLAALLDEPPPLLHPAYQHPATLALLRAAGASPLLDDDRLRALLDGKARTRPGHDGPLALGRYLAAAASIDPGLLHRLQLHQRPWLPDGLGTPRAAEQLYRPSADLHALLGHDPARFPHAEVTHALSLDLLEHLPLRDARDARLDDVAASASAHPGGVPAATLAWLEEGLRRGRLASRDVARAFDEHALHLMDDLGVLRPPQHLSAHPADDLFGRRRGHWHNALRLSKLAAALAIPQHPTPAFTARYLQDIAAMLHAHPDADLLDQHPDLLSSLPRCLARLETLDPLPTRHLAALAFRHDGAPTLTTLDDPRLLLPDPEPLAIEALRANADALLPATGEAWAAVCRTLRRAHLTRPLHRARILDLEAPPLEPSRALQRLADALRNAYNAAPWLPLDDPTPTLTATLRARLTLHGATFEVALNALLHGGRLLVTPDALARPHDLAVALHDPLDEPPPALLDALTDALDLHRDPAEALNALRRIPPPAAARPTPPQDHPDEDTPGLWRRLRRWWRGDQPDATPPTPPPPPPRNNPPPTPRPTPPPRPRADEQPRPIAPSSPDHAAWFRPRQEVNPQLGDRTSWVQQRAARPDYGFAFSPPHLPIPWLYAPQAIFGQWDKRGQRWERTPLDAAWRSPARQGNTTVTLRGRLPAGESVLPVPLYSRLAAIEGGPLKTILAPDGQLFGVAERALDLTLTLTLDLAPDHGAPAAATAAPPALLARTVPDDDLPQEVHDAIARLADAEPLERALGARDFIRGAYRYDPTYLEKPEVGLWLRDLTRGQANTHIAALHASRDERHLGRGVCYELNALAVELLRRLDLPAAVATGWVFAKGAISEPDHLWAMALLPTPEGLRWLPIDASTTRDGRPLTLANRPPGPWRVPPRSAHRLPEPPAWDQERRPTRPSTTPAPPRAHQLRRLLSQLAALTDHPAPSNDDLRRMADALANDPEAIRDLLLRLQRGGKPEKP